MKIEGNKMERGNGVVFSTVPGSFAEVGLGTEGRTNWLRKMQIAEPGG